MSRAPDRSIEELFEEGTAIDEALKSAVREALIWHKKLGNPIAVWENLKVVWIPPEEIDIRDSETDPSGGEKSR